MKTTFSIIIVLLTFGILLGAYSTLNTNNINIGTCGTAQQQTTLINGFTALQCINPNFATIYQTQGNIQNIQQAQISACTATNTQLSTQLTTITQLTTGITQTGTITTTLGTTITTTITLSTITTTLTQSQTTITQGTITTTLQTQTLTSVVSPCDIITQQPSQSSNTGSFVFTTTPCSSNTPLGSLYCTLSGAGQSIKNALANVYCHAVASNNLGGCLTGIAIGNAMPNVIQGSVNNIIQNQLGVSVGGQSTNNSVFGVLANPLNQALLVLGIFIGLGILAGLFGAGILANIIAVAGLALSIITYTEGELGAFGSIPSVIYIPIQSFITILLIILIWDSMSGGKGSD